MILKPSSIADAARAVGADRWPLLLTGLGLILTVGATSPDTIDAHYARVSVLVIGAVMLGAGLVLVAWHYPRPDEVLDTPPADREREPEVPESAFVEYFDSPYVEPEPTEPPK